MRRTQTMRAVLGATAVLVSSLLAPTAVSAASLWAFASNASISGNTTLSDENGTVTMSIDVTVRNLIAGSNGSDGAQIGGRARGTYSVSIMPADGLGACSASGTIDDAFSVSFGGRAPWVGNLGITQGKASEEYDCQTGPADALEGIHLGLIACEASAPAPRSPAEALEANLIIEQIYAGSCGSLTERAVIRNVTLDDSAEPIVDGAPFSGATAPATHRWRDGAGRVLRVRVRASGPGRVRATVRHGRTVLGSGIVTAAAAGTVTVPVTLKVRAISSLLRTRASLPLTIYVAGSTPGLTRRTTLLR
jgi:hypothetical protein